MEVPLGAGSIEVSLPGCAVTVAEPAGGESVNVRRAATSAMASPHGPELSTMVDSGADVAIVVTDVTRDVPDDVLLEVLLSELDGCGVDRDAVTVVVGLGLHRPMTDDELLEMLGPHADLAVNHDPDDTVTVGHVDGCPVELARPVASADVVCSTGVVEPHQYAGFSGGAKTVVIGAGGEPFIRHTHGPDILSKPSVRLGRIDGNPFRDLIDRAGDLVGIDFCCNLATGPAGVLGVSAGEHRAVVTDLAERTRNALAVPIDGQYDAVVAGVGAPKDTNLYQATRAATYVALGAENPVRQEGRIVIPALLPDGGGDGRGERRFLRALQAASDADELYERLRSGYEAGAQRAFVVARVLREHEIWVTHSETPALVADCLMHAAETVSDAIDHGSDVLVVPDAIHTLLVPADTA